MNALERTSVERRRELSLKEMRRDGGLEEETEIFKKETVKSGERQTELNVRMLSHTANGMRVQDGGGGGRGAIGVGDEVDGA